LEWKIDKSTCQYLLCSLVFGHDLNPKVFREMGRMPVWNAVYVQIISKAHLRNYKWHKGGGIQWQKIDDWKMGEPQSAQIVNG